MDSWTMLFLGILIGVLTGYFCSGIRAELMQEIRREEFEDSTYEVAYVTDDGGEFGNYLVRNPYSAYRLPDSAWAERKARAGVPVYRRRIKVLDSWEPYRT